MLTLALASALAVRAELVEAPAREAPLVARPSTSPGRTDRESVIDAERAFDAAAARDGQWTAFRRFAAPDAVMFVPQPINAQEWLKGRADPERSVTWQPRRALLSCDGKFAVTTGDWQRVGSVGYFTTVWRRQADGRWRWILDHGDALTTPRHWPTTLKIERASCRRPFVYSFASVAPPSGTKMGHLNARDRSIMVYWAVYPNGARLVDVAQTWPALQVFSYRRSDGGTVFQDHVKPPKP